MASRLTVLYGETGVGKSSVLRAGVAQELRRRADARRSRRLRQLEGRPGGGAERRRIGGRRCRGREARLPTRWKRAPHGSAETSSSCSTASRSTSSITRPRQERGTFLEEFPEAIRRPGLRASFLVALREDALAKLDRFKASIPEPVRELPASRSSRPGRGAPGDRAPGRAVQRARWARRADVGRARARRGRARPGGDGQGGARPRRPGRRGEDADDADGRIETPFLQLVMERLWDAERDAGSSTLRRSTRWTSWEARSGSFATHLDRALASLTAGAARPRVLDLQSARNSVRNEDRPRAGGPRTIRRSR